MHIALCPVFEEFGLCFKFNHLLLFFGVSVCVWGGGAGGHVGGGGGVCVFGCCVVVLCCCFLLVFVLLFFVCFLLLLLLFYLFKLLRCHIQRFGFLGSLKERLKRNEKVNKQIIDNNNNKIIKEGKR